MAAFRFGAIASSMLRVMALWREWFTASKLGDELTPPSSEGHGFLIRIMVVGVLLEATSFLFLILSF